MKKIILILLLLMLMPIHVRAYSDDSSKVVQQENKKVEELYNYINNMKSQYEVLNNLDVKNYVNMYMKTADGKVSYKNIAKALVAYSFREVAATLKLMAILIIISITCALMNNLQRAFSNETLSNIAYFACYALVIIVMVKSFYIGVDVAKTTITKMTDFMAALMPVLLTLLASVGGFAEATVMDPIIIGIISVSARIFVDFIIPLICITFVLQFINNISEDYKINKLTKLLNQIALWIQGIVMTVFIGVVTIRGITSKTVDQVVAKTAKYAVDNFVPIVGKCLSDAISTVAGYSILLKNAISSLGLIILIVIVIFPIIKVFIIAMMYKLTGALIEPISDSRLVDCITSAGDSLILIMSCLICVSVMFFIMIAIIAAAGKGAIGL